MTAFCACVCVVWSQSVSFADKLKPFGRIWFGRPRQFGTDASSLSFSCSNIETKHSLPSLDGTDTKQRNTNPQRGPKAPFILFFFLVVESGLPCTRKCAQDWGDECKSSLFIPRRRSDQRDVAIKQQHTSLKQHHKLCNSLCI
jgi:hypothetical protein